ncbi:MAG: redox-sensing transcriptional repressor Rex [Verrucomicrobia bacterium]|nr:redox-sensing transcriptional repressor Rex [Verrucomicrobiota bacterium]
MPAHRTIGRLSLYRRLLHGLLKAGNETVHSYELASLADVTAAQVRRDLMVVGRSGTPRRGYNVRDLIDGIGDVLDAPMTQGVALVGAGNLGRAILAYFRGRRPKLSITAAFDVDPAKIGQVIYGCRCYPVDDLERIVAEKGLRVGIVTVPASEAQHTADALVHAGIKGIVNFAPVPLHVPTGVYIEHVDVTMFLEKVAFFSRQNGPQGEQPREQG